MIRNTLKGLKNVKLIRNSQFSLNKNQNRKFSSIQTDEWFIFPRETEGNNYKVNWSLAEDGVVPVGDAFRNARLPVLTKRLGVKSISSSNVIEATKPLYFGDCKVLEAGDSISHDSFNELFSAQQEYLSSGIDLFVEDAQLGSYNKARVGVRVVTDDPAVALIFRNLLIPSPPRPVDHRARFDGWNKDPRWQDSELTWTGENYNITEVSEGIATGNRPITAFVGGPASGSSVAVQFVESSLDGNKVIVGANISCGSSAPVTAVTQAVTLAACVLLNQKVASGIAVPSAVLSKGKSTVVVVGANDSIISAAATNSSELQLLVGAFGSVLTSEGVSVLWNGFVGSSSSALAKESFACTPAVGVNGKAALQLSPNNLSFPATHICFFDNNNTSSTATTINEEDAVKRLVAVTDESKLETIKTLLKGVKLSVVGKSTNLSSLF